MLFLQEPSLQGNPVNRQFLEALRPEGFSSILILADHMEHWEPQAEVGGANNLADADSRCLASLLLLRDIQSSRMHYSNTRQSSMPLLRHPAPPPDFKEAATPTTTVTPFQSLIPQPFLIIEG